MRLLSAQCSLIRLTPPAVLALPHEEVPVAEARAIVRRRQLNDALRFGGDHRP
jgi:hypothetical protein